MTEVSKLKIEQFLSNTYENSRSECHITSDYWDDFVEEIKKLEKKRKSDTKEDFKHFKKMKSWGRMASILGYSTACLIPNPLSAALIAMGNYARWTLVYHPISHGSFDHIEGISKRYKSAHFAIGPRRYIDWFDWIEPKNWNIEHNILHHRFLGTSEDPDIVSRNTLAIRELKTPLFIKRALSFLLAGSWKLSYYSPNTLIEYRCFHNKKLENKISTKLWNPLKKEGREIWIKSVLPYALFRFVLLPSLFLIISREAFLYVLINSLIAEVLTNIYSFCTIATNHTGEDIVTFDGRAVNSADYYIRQILGTVNFPSNSDFQDFYYGGMNFQIEHHIWPNASVYQCKKLRPKLIDICHRYNIPYKEEALRKRVVKLFNAIVLSGKGEIENINRGGLKC